MTGDDLAREVRARCDAQVAEAVAAQRRALLSAADDLEVIAAAAERDGREYAGLDASAVKVAGWLRERAGTQLPREVVDQHLAGLKERLAQPAQPDDIQRLRARLYGDSAPGSSAVAEVPAHRITHAPPRSAVLAEPGHPGTRPQSESLDSPKGES